MVLVAQQEEQALLAAQQRDRGPVDAEQRLEAAEGEESALVGGGDERGGEGERGASKDELKAGGG